MTVGFKDNIKYWTYETDHPSPQIIYKEQKNNCSIKNQCRLKQKKKKRPCSNC